LKVGITLPTFEPSATAALEVARAAERAGIDGVFVFDHLWRGGHRSGPALSMYPVLGAVAAVTRRIRVGSLVARVGFLPDRLVAESFVTLHELTGRRLVAALGIGTRRASRRTRPTGSRGLRSRIAGHRWPPSSASSLLEGSNAGWERPLRRRSRSHAPAEQRSTCGMWSWTVCRPRPHAGQRPGQVRFRPRSAPQLIS